MGLAVRQIAVGGYDDNFSYLIIEESLQQALIVDPCGEVAAVLELADELQLDIVGILITHTHHDHIDALAEVLRMYTVPVYVHADAVADIVSPGKVIGLPEEEELRLGESTIVVKYTPGHHPSSVCFVIPADSATDEIPKVVTGDTLFVEGCGRTNTDCVRALYDSLQWLQTLPPETEVYPGHDYGPKPHSTMQYELENNRFLKAADFAEFKALRLG